MMTAVVTSVLHEHRLFFWDFGCPGRYFGHFVSFYLSAMYDADLMFSGFLVLRVIGQQEAILATV